MEAKPPTNHTSPSVALGLFGALAGGAVGYLAFGWLLQQGFYALALPGAFLGLGCGLLVKCRSLLLAASCGLAALALGLFAEWKHRPFMADESFGYFIRHVHKLQPFTLLMLLVGSVVGFWFALGMRSRKATPRRQEDG